MRCAKCGSSALVHLSSIDQRLCADCLHYNNWKLKPKQKSVLIDGKIGNEQDLLGTEKTVVRGNGEPS